MTTSLAPISLREGKRRSSMRNKDKDIRAIGVVCVLVVILSLASITNWIQSPQTSANSATQRQLYTQRTSEAATAKSNAESTATSSSTFSSSNLFKTKGGRFSVVKGAVSLVAFMIPQTYDLDDQPSSTPMPPTPLLGDGNDDDKCVDIQSNPDWCAFVQDNCSMERHPLSADLSTCLVCCLYVCACACVAVGALVSYFNWHYCTVNAQSSSMAAAFDYVFLFTWLLLLLAMSASTADYW
jgi:hypothetical protein